MPQCTCSTPFFCSVAWLSPMVAADLVPSDVSSHCTHGSAAETEPTRCGHLGGRIAFDE